MYLLIETDDKESFAESILAAAEKDGSAQISVTCDAGNYRAEVTTGCEEPSSS